MKCTVWTSGEPATRSVQTSNPIQISTSNFADPSFQEPTRKDNMNGKLSNRQLLQHSLQNPFMIGNNYIDDLNTQEKFLRPKSSHIECKEQKVFKP